MAYQTENNTTTSKSEIFSKTSDGLGPLEWGIETSEDVDLFFTGGFPESTVAVRYYAGDGQRTYGSVNRGITKIEATNVTTNGVVKIVPTLT